MAMIQQMVEAVRGRSGDGWATDGQTDGRSDSRTVERTVIRLDAQSLESSLDVLEIL